MGCDIHGWIEVRDDKGIWMAVEPINSDRNYLWFSIIAGVRGTQYEWLEHNLENPWRRGVPKDASWCWEDYNKNTDWYHSHTWLTYEEIKTAKKYYEKDAITNYEEGRDWDEPSDKEDLKEMQIYIKHQPLPKTTDSIKKLYINNGNTIPWCGTIGDFMYKDMPMEDCIRMVICVDS